MSIVAIGAAAAAIVGIVKGLKEVYGIVDSDRAVAVTVENHSRWPMRLVHSYFKGGGWADPPDDRIEPGMASVYSAKDTGFLTGTEGTAFYILEGVDPQTFVRIHWSNPFSGQNSAGMSDYKMVVTDEPLYAIFGGKKSVNSEVVTSGFSVGSGNISNNRYFVRDVN